MTTTTTDIKDAIFDPLDFSSEDTINVGAVISAKEEALQSYVDFWKNSENPLEEISVEDHIGFLRLVKEIDDNASCYSTYTELVSSDYAEEFIREHIDNYHYEIAEMGSNHYDWPAEFVEFDIDGAIQSKIESAETVNLPGVTFYILELE